MSEDILQPETWRERDESSDSEPVLSLFKQFLHCKLRDPFIPLKDQRCQPEALKRSNDVVTIDALVSPRALLWLHGVYFIKRSDLQSTGGWAIGNNRRFGTNLISPEFIGNSWTCPQVYRVGDAVMHDARCFSIFSRTNRRLAKHPRLSSRYYIFDTARTSWSWPPNGVTRLLASF